MAHEHDKDKDLLCASGKHTVTVKNNLSGICSECICEEAKRRRQQERE